MQIYIQRNGQQLGPFTEAEIKAQLASGAISPQDNAWWEGQAAWVPLGQSSLAATLPPAFTAPPPAPPPMPPGPPSKTSQFPAWAIVLICGCVGLPFILAFISVVAISVLIALGNQVKSVFTTIDSQIQYVDHAAQHNNSQ